MRPGWCDLAVLDEFFPTRPRSRAQGPTTGAVSCVAASRYRLLAWDYCLPVHECKAVAITTITVIHTLCRARLGFGVVGLVMLRRRNDIRSTAGTVSIGARAALLPALRC